MSNGSKDLGIPHLDTSNVVAEDLPVEVVKRKTWYFECQVRHLNLASFRGLTEASDDPRLDLVSEPLRNMGFPAGQFGPLLKLGRVYGDSLEPVWTADENARRDAFAGKLIGHVSDWMGYKNGARLAAKLKEAKEQFEKSSTSSQLETDPAPIPFRRTPHGWDAGGIGRAISRAMIAEMKPWLIPELYFIDHKDHGFTKIEKWIENLEAYIRQFEVELVISLGGQPDTPIPGESIVNEDPGSYRGFVKLFLKQSTTNDVGHSVTARLLSREKTPDGKSDTYRYDITLGGPGFVTESVDKLQFPGSVKYWVSVLRNSLGECYVNKADADMGLCLIMRTIYLLGTLPASLGTDDDFRWRKRAFPAQVFEQFFEKKAAEVKENAGLSSRLETARTKLRIILEETAANPRSGSPIFSPLAQEIVRRALHSFKFWLDEPFRTSSNEKLIKARTDTGIVDKEKDEKQVKSEMEYWSENHYIMFASSEYLAGQLWETDQFQPGKEFLEPKSKIGFLSGRARKERGRARVLKWLNNRLMFGWTEFNSSGYYREHLWALLNLADFALDREVREKASMAIDLLLFDVVRFHHKGGVGAAGGRSQFKSKSSGFDNALGDVIEILLGSRGVFADADSLIGVAFATSRYEPPEVLLEIGTHPPATPFTDRSRVSITFAEAPKYGIGYSRKSDQKDSVMEGYATKRKNHFPFVEGVNNEIARTHFGYGAAEDDIVFWWGCSAYYNREVVRGTFENVRKFGLHESPIFGGAVHTLVEIVSGLTKVGHGLLGGAVGSLLGVQGAVIGGAAGFFWDDVFGISTLESASDDLSVLLEGSTRTRANILTYRTPDVMMSSIQNFRAGQLNFQSSVNQATLNAAVSIFTSAGHEDIDISHLVTGIGGGVLGALAGAGLGAAYVGVTGLFRAGAAGPYGAGGAAISSAATVGGAAGAGLSIGLYEEAVAREKQLVDHGDGPGWWTGYWALPMVVQHDSAAIIAYDFHTIQTTLAECGTHLWFPKAGFDRVDEMRTSAYDNADFFLLDTFDIGPKGFWLFGMLAHPPNENNERAEAYIGVFSNQRPEWLDQGSDFYEQIIKDTVRQPIEEAQKKIQTLLDKLEEGDDKSKEKGIGFTGRQVIQIVVERSVDSHYTPGIARHDWHKKVVEDLAQSKAAILKNHMAKVRELAEHYIDLKTLQRIWPDPLPRDYFANRDWFVDGKNLWIVQIGSRAEFGDFQTFKNRVSRARIHLDDAGDLECSYDIPRAGGRSQRLSMALGDGGRFGLDGGGFQTDLYPRFENPFLRGGRVEWGQREYVIEHRGKLLFHDFSNFASPIRSEEFASSAQQRHTVRGLVIYLRTGDEELEEFTVATADVSIACVAPTKDQVVASGPIDEDTTHDAEWIFFEVPLNRQPDMTLTLKHPASSKGEAKPHWKMSFTLRALMGDRMLRDCSLPFSDFEFEGDKRTSNPFPFAVSMSEWTPWEELRDHKSPSFWTIARKPDPSKIYCDHNDLFVLDKDSKLWHGRLGPCNPLGGAWSQINANDGGGDGAPGVSTFFATAVSSQPNNLFLLIQSGGALFAASPNPLGAWTNGWRKLDVYSYPDLFLGIPDTSAARIPVALSAKSRVSALPSSLSEDGIEIFVLAADDNYYSHPDWRPGDAEHWRKIEVIGFSPLVEAEFRIAGHFLFVLASDRSLWCARVDHSSLHLSPAWEKVTADGISVSHFTATCEDGSCQVVVVTSDGKTSAASYTPGSSSVWVTLAMPEPTAASGPLAATQPSSGRAQFFVVGTDKKIYVVAWSSAVGWPGMTWQPVIRDSQPLVEGALIAITRVKGMVELFAQSNDKGLFKSWWS